MNDSLKLFATQVVRCLVDAGHRAVFAGGCVRDMLLGQPPKDFDVATSATPQQVMALFPRHVPVGAAFGVVRVLGPAPEPGRCREVEVATFRGETTYSDGRHPDQVCFTDEVEDVKRRDFTINGLLFDPLKNEVLDHVGGRRDLERKLIRAIGDPKRRFAEDHLRMLRAIRFATRLDFEIEGATLGAIADHAEKIAGISAERVRDELSLMLSGPAPRRAFELLKRTRLLKYILPEVEAMEGVAQPPQFHPEGDVWTHTLLLLGQLDRASVTLALGALLHDVGKPPTFEPARPESGGVLKNRTAGVPPVLRAEDRRDAGGTDRGGPARPDRIRFNEHDRVGAEMAEEILKRLRYPGAVVEQAVSLVRQHMVFKDVRKMRPAKLARFLRQPNFTEHLELHRIDCLASHGDLAHYEFCKAELERSTEQTLRPAPLITGEDLIALGLQPGPAFKTILTEIEDRQLEGVLQDKAAALELAREMIQNIQN